ncbi:MAG: DegT/DnrJ/EryC1/StrS family aminotransferase [Rhodospirillaceae bacterium]|nr:DegT/DnrJ/EryC1/StrS family aminotransferase [Rhodospirillaceae bacterium]
MAQRADIDAAILRVLNDGWYIMGEEVAAFEREFAAFAKTRFAVGVASGTDALTLGLRALDVGPGDAVITVSHTAVATVAAIELAGATPVLVDIGADWTMDPRALGRLLDAWPAGVPKAKAIVPVHLYGQPAAMAAIAPIAEAHDLIMLEDCSQAHGAGINNRLVGSWSRLAAYSLYPTKNLGALGDAGVISTDDPVLQEKLCALRQYGWRDRYISDMPGINSRLDPIQAGVLRVKLQVLERDTERRRAIAARYDAGLAGLSGLVLPARSAGYAPVFHQYVVNAGPRRDALQAALKARDILTVIHYPVPIHLQPAYRGKIAIGPGGLPQSELAAHCVLSLPMFPQLSDEDVDCVIAAIRGFWQTA